MTAQAISTGTAKTAQRAEGEACERGGEAMRPNTITHAAHLRLHAKGGTR